MTDQADIDGDEPIFFDLETRSACDLKAAGGWNYAADPTTHLLTVAWSAAPDEYNIWYPWHTTIREDYTKAQGTTARCFTGSEIPTPILEAAASGRKWCAHNGWSFDALVWGYVMPPEAQPVDWLDTEPLARAIGLPGGLDAIGKRLWGEGKYKAAKDALKKYSRGATRYGDAADVPAGVMPMLAEYNVQDVVLLRGVWQEVKRWLKMPREEWDVLEAHRAINHRGAPFDQELLVALIDLTDEGRTHAVKRVAELTKDQGDAGLKTVNDLQSRNKVFAWLDKIGVSLSKEPSLRKELVQQFIDTHTNAAEDEGDDDQPSEEEGVTGGDIEEQRASAARTMLAVQVLQLRSAALRITGGKLAAAASAVCNDGRIRGLFVYAGAHTFRWAGRRVQVHNLPRPKDGIKMWEYLDAYNHSRFVCPRPCLPYATIDALLPDRTDRRYRYLTPDDVSSAMIRMLIAPPRAKGDPHWSANAEQPGVLAADLANIEARVLAWLAGEKWLMDAFWAGEDPYLPMAEVVFGPRATWPVCKDGIKKHPRRQVGKVIELGSGYQLGGKKMNVYAAAQQIDLAAQGTSGEECVLAYRKKHPAIAGRVAGEYNGQEYFRDGFWHKLNDAAIAACKTRGVPYVVGVGAKITFVCEGPHLMVYLPSGRRLIYRDARVENCKPKYLIGTEKTIEGVVYVAPRFGRTEMYGGKWAENIVQAVSRDFLAYGLVLLERAEFEVCLHVHDEGVGGGTRCTLSAMPEFMANMTTCPPWARNFPLDAEGGWMPRYSKSPPPGDRYKEQVWRNGVYLKQA